MLILRKSQDRGYADHGWLRSFHSFSFAGYHDPRFMGFGNLRVINEDRIAPGTGFATHAHRDMEIISVVLSGALAHRDSMGNTAVIPAGDVQVMSAGSGVTHSEYNHASGEDTHFLQIWIEPSQRGLEPSYGQTPFGWQPGLGLRLLASGQAEAGALRIHADAALRAGYLAAGETADLALDAARKTYVHLVRGGLRVNGQSLQTGDAAMLEGEAQLQLEALREGALVLVFDLSQR